MRIPLTLLASCLFLAVCFACHSPGTTVDAEVDALAARSAEVARGVPDFPGKVPMDNYINPMLHSGKATWMDY